jgi:hypothetical protein
MFKTSLSIKGRDVNMEPQISDSDGEGFLRVWLGAKGVAR